MLLLFLFLWFVTLDHEQPEEEQGIELAFGDALDGGGNIWEETEAHASTPEPSYQDPEPSPVEGGDVMTQEDEEALAAKAAKAEEERLFALEQAHKKKLQEEQQRIEAEKRRLAEAKAAEEKAKKEKASALISGIKFGNTGGGDGSGTTSGSSNQGDQSGRNAVGDGFGSRKNYSLGNRKAVSEPPAPKRANYQPGTVVLKIQVNAAGEVIAASIESGTISDASTLEMAKKFARQYKFAPSDQQIQYGKIRVVVPE